ncbi:hypothetical protein ORG37_23905 [Rahnella perminowiae]|nr:hypothetical protein [Rahnella perminowiae]MCX2946120.1 hypothetical protein [Rahnella perminowiae]
MERTRVIHQVADEFQFGFVELAVFHILPVTEPPQFYQLGQTLPS